MKFCKKRGRFVLTDNDALNWFLDLTAAKQTDLPFKAVEPGRISCKFEGMEYSVDLEKGSFSKPNDYTVFRISASENSIQLHLVSENEK